MLIVERKKRRLLLLPVCHVHVTLVVFELPLSRFLTMIQNVRTLMFFSGVVVSGCSSARISCVSLSKWREAGILPVLYWLVKRGLGRLLLLNKRLQLLFREGLGFFAIGNEGMAYLMGKANIDHSFPFFLCFLDRGYKVGI